MGGFKFNLMKTQTRCCLKFYRRGKLTNILVKKSRKEALADQKKFLKSFPFQTKIKYGIRCILISDQTEIDELLSQLPKEESNEKTV
jgi:hypothetical protein